MFGSGAPGGTASTTVNIFGGASTNPIAGAGSNPAPALGQSNPTAPAGGIFG